MKAATVRLGVASLLLCALAFAVPAAAQEGGTAPTGVTPPPDYVVGPEDVLAVVFWREQNLSAEVVVRPDGKISLPLLNDIDVAGLTPDQVRERIVEKAADFVDEPTATIVVKQIHSRKIFITGSVERPGPFPLMQPTTVLQLIAMAGGLREFANASDIVVVRLENGQQVTYEFNYNDVKNRRNLAQNIVLKPGDTVIVP